MAVSDALNNFRKGGYGGDDDDEKTSRVINLTDEEKKELEGYQGGPGEEITCEVSGKLEDDHFHVMSVRATGGGASQEDMAKVAGMEVPPTMRTQTQISPS